MTLVGVADSDVADAVCASVRARIEEDGATAVTIETATAHIDIGLVDVLARALLLARSYRCPLRIRADARLVALVELAGLRDVLPLCDGLAGAADEPARSGDEGR